MRFFRPLLFALLLPAALLVIFVTGPQPEAEGAPQAGRYQGKLLVSTSQNRDPRFDKTVLYMVRHSDDGAVGIVVNKPYGKGPLEKMMKGLALNPGGANKQLELHYGGPVAINHVFILHSSDYAHERSRDVDGTVSFTKDAKVLNAFAAGNGPKRILVAVGYAGWSAGQLEHEMKRGVWTVAQSSEDLVFGNGKSDAWDRIVDAEEIPL